MSDHQEDHEGVFVVGLDEETGDIGFAYEKAGEDLKGENWIIFAPEMAQEFIAQLQDAVDKGAAIKQRIAARRLLS